MARENIFLETKTYISVFAHISCSDEKKAKKAKNYEFYLVGIPKRGIFAVSK